MSYVGTHQKQIDTQLALKIGHSLKKCCAIEACASIKNADEKTRKDSEDFMYLCDKECVAEVSSAALTTLAAQKMNKPQLIPLTEDIRKLNGFIADESKRCCTELESGTNLTDSWKTLAKVTLVSIVLFNRRRTGEVGRMKLSEYNNRNKNPLGVQDIADSLTGSV